MKKHYAVYGVDKTYRWLWLACVAAGIKAAKDRYRQSTHSDGLHSGQEIKS